MQRETSNPALRESLPPSLFPSKKKSPVIVVRGASGRGMIGSPGLDVLESFLYIYSAEKGDGCEERRCERTNQVKRKFNWILRSKKLRKIFFFLI